MNSMYENRQRSRNTNSRIRNNSRGRSRRPFSSAPGNQLNTFRMPSLSFSRRRTMGGRYPNMGFRHHAPTRPGCPTPGGFSHAWRNPRPNLPTAISSSLVHKPPFNVPHNTFDNRNNRYSLPTVNNNEDQVTTGFSGQNCKSGESNAFSDLWVEALAPGGKIYYYNSRTRETTWEKPFNVRIIGLNEINQLPVRPNMEKSEKVLNGNSNQCVQQQPMNNSQVNTFYPQTTSAPSASVLFPPNVFTPPPNFLRPPAENIQKSVANVGFVMPRPLLPTSVVPCNLFPNDVINNCNISVTQNVLPSNNIIEFNSNVSYNLFPSSNIGNYNSNAEQNLFPNNITSEYNSNFKQNLFLNNIIGEYNFHNSQDSLPSNNVVEYVSNVTQDFLSNNNMDEYNLDDAQDLSLSMCENIDKCDFNVPKQDLLPKNETVHIANKQQNLLSDNEITDFHKNAIQNCLSTSEIDEQRAKVSPQNLFSDNEKTDFHKNTVQNSLSAGKRDDRREKVTLQNELSDNEIIDSHQNTVQNSLSTGKMDDRREKVTSQSLFSSNEKTDFHKNTIQNCLSTGEMDDSREKTKRNLFPKTKVINYSSSDSDEAEADNSIPGTEEIKFVENKYLNISSQESNLSPSSSNFAKITKSAHETPLHHKNEKSFDLKSENIVHTTKSEDFDMVQTKFKSSVNLLNKNKPVDKSRPVCSTPVPGSYWCVVWTGDDRVFFYDSKRKISVWERPAELLNRSDVDKMVKQSPLSLDMKPLTKEARKSSSDRSDVTKKQKKDNEKDENSEVKMSSEKIDSENIVVQTTSETDSEAESESFSPEWKIEMFREMLSEMNVSTFSTWEKEAHKLVFDPRYLLLPEEERKQVFNDYIKRKSQEEINKREREESQKEAFLSLLMETGVTSSTSLLSDLVVRHSEDGRFTAIEELEIKENIFNQYVAELKQKEQETEKLESELKTAFIELLTENNCFDKEWSEAQTILANDDRYKAVHCDSLKENLFKKYVEEKRATISLIEKQELTKADLVNRDEEIKQDLSGLQKNQVKKKYASNNKHTSAVSNFKALLKDLIEDSNINWESAKTVLKSDQRWCYARHLGPEKCEKLFDEHINAEKKDQFCRFLDECLDITLKTSWLDIRKQILKDPRCIAFSSCEGKCEKEFKEYLKSKRTVAKNEFKQLLKETKLITPDSKSLLNCSGSRHLQDIEKALSEDKRYSNLECIRSERKKILLSYINELHAEGTLSLSKPREKAKRMKRKK